MDFKEFERRARRVWDEIPAEFREGVDGLVVERDPEPHPTLPGTYTLGECVTEAYPSEYDGPDNVRSIVVLYYGSFRGVAADDPEFDWAYEIWETVTHEIRHHLESLADEDDLEEVDYAADENFKRLAGRPFDPEFYRSGEQTAPGIFEVEQDVFMEITYPADAEPRERGSAPRADACHAGRRVLPADHGWPGRRPGSSVPGGGAEQERAHGAAGLAAPAAAGDRPGRGGGGVTGDGGEGDSRRGLRGG
ncbi:MAG: metallopeptidase family protein [Gemmatimonadota bacterium]